jgi:hypothetical protein
MADDMDEPASLADILGALRAEIQKPVEECDWDGVINYFGHIELYRREVVDQARESTKKGPQRPGKVLQSLQKLANPDLDRRRRKDYLVILINLCRSHVQLCLCSKDEWLVGALLKKYFPPKDTDPNWIPHVGLSSEERKEIAEHREFMVRFLKNVQNWELELDDESDNRREQYLGRFGEPFGQSQSGGQSIGEVALLFAAKVENNANALELLNRLG